MENQTQNNIFQNLAYVLFLAGAFLLPLSFAPQLANPEILRWYLLVIASALGLVLWSADCLVKRRFDFASPPLAKPLLALSAVYLLTNFLNASNKIAPFWGKTGFVIAGAVFYLVGTNILGKKAKHLFFSLLASSFVLSWVKIFSYLGILSKLIPQIPAFANNNFSPAGDNLTLASILAILLPASVVFGLKTKDSLTKLLVLVVSAVQTAALMLALSQLLPGLSQNPLVLLPYSAGWSIALDQFKTVKTALLGVGVDDFLSAFTLNRPASLNMTAFWNIRFASSSNEIFTVLTTTGLLGALVFTWIYGVVIKTINNKSTRPLNMSLGTGLILVLIAFFLIPASNLLIFVFLALALALTGSQAKIQLKLKKEFLIGISAGFCLLSLIAGYLSTKVVLAEQTFTKSLKTASQNKGGETYNLQIKAISQNPYAVRYRLAYANTNFALANSLASQEKISDDDKKTITQLVSQSIREAKNAAALSPKNPAVWENLANIYRQLTNMAQDAQNWAITSYVQAVRLDPTNPRLRIDLGGFLYALQNYDEAIDQFKRAIDLKPDLANAYYNLSFAYKQKKEYPLAYSAMQSAIKLVESDSADFEKAKKDLEDLQALLPEEMKTATASGAKKPGGQLQAPAPLPSPNPVNQSLPLNQQEKKDLAPEVPKTPEGNENIISPPKEATSSSS